LAPSYECCFKINSDGAATCCPELTTCGGIFQNHMGDMLGCFAQSIPVSIAFHGELQAAMLAIEIAATKEWMNIWLECNFSLVVQAFKDSKMVP